MSAALTFSSKATTEYTLLSNRFIDRYMPQANGSYVKVYLYLLRLFSEPSFTATLTDIADVLDETEKDIERALKYWEKQGLLTLTRDADGVLSGILLLPIPQNGDDRPSGNPLPSAKQTGSVSSGSKTLSSTDWSNAAAPPSSAVPTNFEKPDYSDAQITELTSLDEVKWLMSRLEQTLGRLLKPADLQTLLFLYESIGFPAELIVYLYEYCASKNKKNTSYIEAVAIAWAQAGVDSIEKAETQTAAYNRNYTVVNRAFGLNRTPGGIEMKYIHRWFDTFCFDNAIIEEACNRTILAVSKPDFKYADKILTNWHEAGIKKKEDIAALDSEFARKNAAQNVRQKESAALPAPNRFGIFPQRQYTASDYSAMEEMLLRKDTTHAD